ncbi:MAG: hypothetical protein JSW60_01155 [Thermoplasmatales archaeon]|nr:MAG: hypothetical protein JSW60_01155 [Thermoplasmatales archaeon]
MFHVKCDELFSHETAFLVIPLTEGKLEYEVRSSDKEVEESYSPDYICRIKGWHDKTPLRVRKGTLTIEDTGQEHGRYMEWLQ